MTTSPGGPAGGPPRRRHLMDPANPQRSTGSMSMSSVQRWVMSVLAVTTILHLAGGLALAAVFVDTTRAGADIGLLVIAAAVGVLGVASGFLIHQRNPVTPWLLLGLLPAAIGLAFLR